MTLLEFAGYTLISFGPAVILFCKVVAKDPVLIIILISAAFFWLVSLLISSIIWFATVPLRDQLAFGITVAVLFQELFRYLFYQLLRTAEGGLQKVSQVGVTGSVAPISRLSLSFVSGLGFGIISGVFSLLNLLSESFGPGSIGIDDKNQNFFLTSSIATLAFILLHTFWGVILYQSLDKKEYQKVLAVVLCHLGVSYLSLLNQNGLQAISLTITYLTLVGSACAAFLSAGGVFPCRSPQPSNL